MTLPSPQGIALSLLISLGLAYSSPALSENAAVALADTKVMAAEAAVELTAHQVVAKTTDDVMKVIVEAQGYYDKDPQRFFAEIENILGQVVDFDSFARGVMGKYASKSRYMSLQSDAEKTRFRTQVKRFSTTFKDGLVQTYAKGLLAFNGNRIELLPTSANDQQESKSVTVVQHIYGAAEKPYEVHYKLRQNRSGDWKLRNVTIEAVNLGKVYQSQFYSAAKQYNGDIDKVIDNWSVDPTAEASAG